MNNKQLLDSFVDKKAEFTSLLENHDIKYGESLVAGITGSGAVVPLVHVKSQIVSAWFRDKDFLTFEVSVDLKNKELNDWLKNAIHNIKPAVYRDGLYGYR